MFAVPFILPDKKRTSKKARPPAELKGFVERVTFHNPENGFSVLRVSDKKHWGADTVVGFASPVSAGLYIHATGRWQSCEDGHQLRAEVIRTKLPTETDDIQKCLGSGLVEGIGPAYAERFMETFGGKSSTSSTNTPRSSSKWRAWDRSVATSSPEAGPNRRPYATPLISSSTTKFHRNSP